MMRTTGISPVTTRGPAEGFGLGDTAAPKSARAVGVQAPVDVSKAVAARPIKPSDPEYARLPAARKQAVLWRATVDSAYEKLPPFEQGFVDKMKGFAKLMDAKAMTATFAEEVDVRSPRLKPLFTFGSSAKIEFEPNPNSPFTGLWKSGGPGFVRLSLASDEKAFCPAIGLKLFTDAGKSVDLHLGVPDEQKSRDPFKVPMTNVFAPPERFFNRMLLKLAALVGDPLERKCAHVGEVDRKGQKVADAHSPRQIWLESSVHFADDTPKDLRDNLAAIPAGTRLWRVMGRADGSDEKVHVGDLRLSSNFVASEFGDRELHFFHQK